MFRMKCYFTKFFCGKAVISKNNGPHRYFVPYGWLRFGLSGLGAFLATLKHPIVTGFCSADPRNMQNSVIVLFLKTTRDIV